MKYHVNANCIGCGLCAGICPGVFTMSNEDVAIAIETEVLEEDLESAAKAKENCPAEAIEEVNELKEKGTTIRLDAALRTDRRAAPTADAGVCDGVSLDFLLCASEGKRGTLDWLFR